ncbi:2-hydroxyacid dehydrogenase [Crenobacter sp. SG2303]|uniref:2-hydroxyacid dehydrogenase n=1 Tax=Crenobacter oryzisoli TaxID=3056844 RepID=A0ABT7XKG6_9NEIS|nr:2-hydroxyacid dehydrogenase [Crenobacter sp. SG2303]MDN0074284.1 2-hydroxyacid dehydrogenase [Crenobacter sp. SG2303]
MQILQIGPLSAAFNQRLADAYPVTALWSQTDPAAFLAAEGGHFDAVVTSSRFGLSAAQLELLPALRAVCSFGVGYDAIDVAAARERGVMVSNTPDVLTDCVADLAFGLIIDVARRVSEADRFVRAGQWAQGGFPLGHRVSGKRLGIVGLGRIGQAIARRAAGFDMQIAYHNRKAAEVDYRFEPSLTALADWADFLVLSCPGGAATHHLVSTEVLAALGPQGVLVNVARGAVVDEAALVSALLEGRLGGAGLDVFAAEPQVPEALLALPNVVLLPHIASGTVETRLQMEELVFANLAAYASDQPLVTPV